MKEFSYILFIVFLTIFVLLYGGHNNQNLVEYEHKYFTSLNRIIIFENKLRIFNQSKDLEEKGYIDIKNYLKTCNYIVPNLVELYMVRIKPNSFFPIKSIFKETFNNHVMIIFNHNKVNDLELFIGSNENNQFGYFYDLKKVISITSIYDIYNNSNKYVNITIFFVKKPFWFE